MTGQDRPRALFLGVGYAGHFSRFMNLRANVAGDPRIRAEFEVVQGWVDGGLVERLRFLPASVRGRLRATISARPIARIPRPDVTWSAGGEVTLPWLWSQFGPLRRPFVFDLDATFDQMEAMAPLYWKREPRQGARLALSHFIERTIWRGATLFTPWSNWAAEGLRERGVPAERIRVLPPGVDLDYWRAPLRDDPGERPLRLLFVGGDFERKGGTFLLDALRGQPHGRFELDIVTRDQVPAGVPGVRVHRAEPGSPLLRELYQRADVFMLPTRAECFGIAAVEALAAGLPVVMGDVGGARDIVDDGENGWLIQPTVAGIARALDTADCQREQLPALGRAARAKAERRFDGHANDSRLVDVMLEQVELHGRRH